MITQRKIEANRRNAQKSTGPRTDEGKARVKLNALKHGMTAATVVLPHEDGAAYERRLETWSRELNPPGELGQYLAERVVRISWQLDRADSHERARLTRRVRDVPRDRDRARNMAVTALMNRLFDEDQAPEPTGLPAGPDLSREGPADTLARLEDSAEGCRRLLAEWIAIKVELDRETEADRMTEEPLADLMLIGQGRVLRLLGLSDKLAAIQARTDRRVAAIVQIQKHAQEHAIARFLRLNRVDDPHALEDDPPVPAALNAQVAIDPRHLSVLKEALRSTIDSQFSRLEALLAEHEAERGGEDCDTDDQAAFDDSPEGERLHRYQSYWSRSLLRTLDALEKLRKQRTVDVSDREEEPAAIEDSTEAAAPVAAEEPAEGLAKEPPAADLPAAPTHGPGGTELESLPQLRPDASGSPPCPTESDPQPKSAKQSHREAEPTELIPWPGAWKESPDGGRARGGDLKT